MNAKKYRKRISFALPVRLPVTRLFRPPWNLFWLWCFLIAVVQPVSPAFQAEAAETASLEYTVKAAFIHNFTKFIDWPKSAFSRGEQGPFIIAVVGQDPFGAILDKSLVNKRVRGRRIAIRRLSSPNDIRGEIHCLFVSSDQRANLPKILRKVRHRPVLLVGDSPGFAQAGIGINFFNQGRKVRFEINPVALEKAGLRVSSQLLNLARIVEGR